jgi:hypothetical protein
MLEIQIPTKTLAVTRYSAPIGPDEESAEEEILPEANDPIDFRAEGIVKAVKGDTATVEIRFINGKRPEMAAKKPAMPDDGDTLRANAEAADASEEEE